MRRLSTLDLPWLAYLCRKKYSDSYDADLTAQWFTEQVLRNPLMYYAIRTDNAFCIAYINTFPWLPGESDCNVNFICADDGKMWEAVRLLRATIDWAKRRNCKNWWLAGDTDIDLKMIAWRLQAREQWPRFKLQLR